MSNTVSFLSIGEGRIVVGKMFEVISTLLTPVSTLTHVIASICLFCQKLLPLICSKRANLVKRKKTYRNYSFLFLYNLLYAG